MTYTVFWDGRSGNARWPFSSAPVAVDDRRMQFHGCDSIVGIFFHNWFIDMPMFPGVTSWQIASYEIDLLKYYHEYEENTYIYKEGFSTEAWSKYQVYVP